MEGSHDESDVIYHHLAVEVMLSELDAGQMSCLVTFIPSLKELISNIDTTLEGASILAGSDVSLWQLVFLIIQGQGSLLSLGRHILVRVDDLQWCNSSMLTLISELITTCSRNRRYRLLPISSLPLRRIR